MRDTNIALIKKGYDAFAKGDLEAIRELSTEDGIWRTAGYEPFQPEYKGFEGITQYLTKLFESTDGTFKSDPVAFFAEGDRVAVLCHVTASRMGRTLDTFVVQVFDMHDGKVFETTDFLAEPSKLQSFWA